MKLSEKGLLTFAEIAIGTLIIALLIVVGVSTLRVTEKGTVSQKVRQQALNLAKARSEELKSYLNSQGWNNMLVDVAYPPPQTPAVPAYKSYAPTTITMGRNTFIVDPEVRYVQSDNTNQVQLVPTPANSATPEFSNMVRIRVDGYYGPVSEFVPLPTAEVVNNLKNRVVYSNYLANDTINVGGTGQISGYVFINCSGTQPVTNTQVEVGVYQGSQKIQSALTDSNGYYAFDSVPSGILNVQVVSAPGYQPYSVPYCNFTNPVTLNPGSSLNNVNLGVTPLSVMAYFGVVVRSTPVFNPVIPTSPTPTPNATMVVAPVANAVVFSDDGNSLPVTATSSGAYTITQVRMTPVTGHNYDTIEGDDVPVTQKGLSYNRYTGMTTGNFTSGGTLYVGPITIFVNSLMTNTQTVTFYVMDEQYNALSGGYLPLTLTAQDGSPSPPTTIFSSAGPVTLNVHPGNPTISVSLKGNTSPAPSYITYNQPTVIDASVTAPLTLVCSAVGSMAGTVSGMGTYFNYSQFSVRAYDDQGQYVYSLPVSYDGFSSYGTFSYAYLRTPLNVGGDLVYNFTVNGGGDYTSTTETYDVQKGQSHHLNNNILVNLLNVYAAVTVTKGGTAYPYGAWISAQPGSLAAPPTTGMGSGYSVSNYYSGITKGDGTTNLQVQLMGGASTTYTIFAQIVDPTTYALSTKAVTTTMTTANVFTSPMGVSFSFP